jgi:hypothetical protein
VALSYRLVRPVTAKNTVVLLRPPQALVVVVVTWRSSQEQAPLVQADTFAFVLAPAQSLVAMSL